MFKRFSLASMHSDQNYIESVLFRICCSSIYNNVSWEMGASKVIHFFKKVPDFTCTLKDN